MNTEKRTKGTRPTARDLSPRNGQAVRGGKKAPQATTVEQQKLEMLLQELQDAPRQAP